MVSTGAVSVVIPNHNRATTLEAAVASVLAQDYPDIEVLVCDDGSSDESEDVVRSFDDARVRWLPGPRTGGPAAPRNRGVAAATGEWVAFLDSDDTWAPGKIKAQLAAVAGTTAFACATNAHRLVPGSETPVGMLHRCLPERITLSAELTANLVITSSLLVRELRSAESAASPRCRDGSFSRTTRCGCASSRSSRSSSWTPLGSGTVTPRPRPYGGSWPPNCAARPTRSAISVVGDARRTFVGRPRCRRLC